MSSRQLLVTIVTPCYNSAEFLPATIESVFTQDYPQIEYIVADGGSTDATLKVLESHRGRLRYFSGRDTGPSDAIDRGFRDAAGDIFAWINADDIYLPGAVREAAEYLMAHPEVDVVYGEGNWIDKDGGVIDRYPSLPFDPRALETECFICQPAAFFRASAYRRCRLDPHVKLSFDYDFWIRLAKQGARFAFIPQYLACTRMHRGALTLRVREDVLLASMKLLKRHYGYVPLQWIISYTMFQADGRDQFFEPQRSSLRGYLASLPAGFRFNSRHRVRFLAEWLAAGFSGLARRFRLCVASRSSAGPDRRV